jgi:hypothetical protein
MQRHSRCEKMRKLNMEKRRKGRREEQEKKKT